jgi:nicotinate-nucleotide adenylyltransferase
MAKKPIIGLFGGTFDPIHFGHLNLALSLLESKKVDHVLFCPANTSPLKKGEPPRVTGKMRRAMVELAIEPIPEFSLLDYELKRDPPSYTIDTVRELIKEKRGEIRLILGDDALLSLHQWHEVEELLKLAPPLIGTRLKDLSSQFPSLEKAVVQIPVMEISSTEIRKRLKEKKYCGHLVPARVLDYIYEKELYVK